MDEQNNQDTPVADVPAEDTTPAEDTAVDAPAAEEVAEVPAEEPAVDAPAAEEAPEEAPATE